MNLISHPRGLLRLVLTQALLFTLIVATASGATLTETLDLTAQGWAAGTEVGDVAATYATVRFDKGSGSLAPTYYAATPAGVRLYPKGRLTISSDLDIISIELSYNLNASRNGVTPTLTTSTGALNGATWTGSNKALTLTVEGTGGTASFLTLKLTYSTAGTDFPSRLSAGLSFGATTAYDVLTTETFTPPTLTYATDGAISYDTSNPQAVSVDAATGEVELLAAGEAVITARSAATATYAAGEAAYTLTVRTPLWQEDWSGATTGDYAADVQPYYTAETNYFASVQPSSYAGGAAPELYLTGSHFYQAKVALHGVSGAFRLTYRTSQQDLRVTSTDGVAVSDPTTTEYEAATGAAHCTRSITVAAGLDSLTLVFMHRSKDTYLDDFVLASTTDSVDLELTEAGCATLYYGAKALRVPAGLTAYTLHTAGSGLAVGTTYAEGSKVPAGTGVVVIGTAGWYRLASSRDIGTTDAANALRGTDGAAQTAGGARYYKLSLPPASSAATAAAFFWGAKGGAAFSNKPHKAYLPLPASAAAPTVRLPRPQR